MKYKILVTALVLFVLALVMLAPVAAQNDVTVDQTTHEYNQGNWDESFDYEAWVWVGFIPAYHEVSSANASGNWWDHTDTNYYNEFNADYGGGTGESNVYVDSYYEGNSQSTTTVDTFGSPAPGVIETTNTVIETQEDWWGEYSSDTNTTWSPSP